MDTEIPDSACHTLVTRLRVSQRLPLFRASYITIHRHLPHRHHHLNHPLLNPTVGGRRLYEDHLCRRRRYPLVRKPQLLTIQVRTPDNTTKEVYHDRR